MYTHDDMLELLNRSLPLQDKLEYIHTVLRERYAFISRISIAIYDPKTDLLKTYVHSSGGDQPLSHYQAKLSEASSLQEILDAGKPRVIDNMTLLAGGNQEHTRRIREQGYQASYTMPMYLNSVFFGFIFFNSYDSDPFTQESLHYMDIFGHLVSLLITSEISSIHTLLSAIKTARDVAQHRDIETGAHLDRMARYAGLIAGKLADKYDLDDEYIEHVFLFAPLHDIGKIGIPDTILLKPGKLTEEEFNTMKKHVDKGREIIDEMLRNFGLETFQHIDVLRNIASYHHEAINGSGYPHGLEGDDIPIEARIVAVADVFDALTSRRPYKEAWSNEAAFNSLQKLAGITLDKECVEVLMNNPEEVEAIQQRFREDQYG